MGCVKNTAQVIKDVSGKIDDQYSLYTSNIDDIRAESANALDMIHKSFCFGYAQGMKAAKAKM